MSNSVQNLVNTIGALSVIELAELTKALEEKFGVSAAMPMASAPVAAASAGAAAGAAEAEEKAEFKVELLDGGAEKIKTIKALRKVKKDLGLTEAKTMVDSAPVVIAEGVSKADAKMMKDELEAAGAKVKLS
jgi:large subunit ribosomal protein L7/L12